MRKALLLFFATFLTISLYAQRDCDGCEDNGPDNDLYQSDDYQSRSTDPTYEVDITIYPNPATDFIIVNDEQSTVNQVIVYNLIGRKMKGFRSATDNKYFVGDLPKGMYLVQMLGTDGNVITTQRISKR